MTRPIKETVERLRAPLQVVATGGINDPAYAVLCGQSARKSMIDAAALIERLAGALEPFANRAEHVDTLGVTDADPLPDWLKDCQAARRALSGEPSP